ncbi:MAG TPA: hypothetical protein VHD87_12855 [Acidimicrobiales bacterium]|nr:hypothetical protein [Acidimicrobiales bacterium]
MRTCEPSSTTKPVVTLVAPGWSLAHLAYHQPGEDSVTGVLFFAVRDGIDARVALDAAIEEWAGTSDAVEKLGSVGYAFNIGDLYDEMPPEAWARHGLVPVHVPSTKIGVVEHDRGLVDNDADFGLSVTSLRFSR